MTQDLPPTLPKERGPTLWLLALAMGGCGLACYLTWLHYYVYGNTDYQKLTCDMSTRLDCGAVISSEWSEIQGVPIAAAAAGVMLGIAIVNIAFRGRFRANGVLVGAIASWLSLAASLVFLAIMLVSIQHWCIYCLALDAVITCLAVGYLFSWRRLQRRPGWWGTMAAVAIMLVSLSGTVWYTQRKLDSHWHQINARAIATILASQPRNTKLDFSLAPVTIDVYTDYSCPNCRKAINVIKKVASIYGDKVRIEYRRFPLDRSCNTWYSTTVYPTSCRAARVGIWARDAGRYDAVADELHAAGKSMENVLKKYEAMPEVQAGMEKAAVELSEELRQARQAGVSSVPTCFVNGHRFEGPRPLPVWRGVIDELLRRQAKGEKP